MSCDPCLHHKPRSGSEQPSPGLNYGFRLLAQHLLSKLSYHSQSPHRGRSSYGVAPGTPGIDPGRIETKHKNCDAGSNCKWKMPTACLSNNPAGRLLSLLLLRRSNVARPVSLSNNPAGRLISPLSERSNPVSPVSWSNTPAGGLISPL